jgi:tetratricopeptide (TPR) repeat protein
MPSEEVNNFKRAMALLNKGYKKQSALILLRLYEKSTKIGFKIQLIDALITVLDPMEDNEKLIELSSSGISLASALNVADVGAHFKARKADFLMGKRVLLEFERVNLKLAQKWLQFATEKEKTRYEELSLEISKIDEEVSNLLGEAVEGALHVGNKKTLALVYMSKGGIEGSRYLQFKMNTLRGSWRARVFLVLHKFGIEIPFIYGLRQGLELIFFVNSFTKSFIDAANLLTEIGDEDAALAYFDLAVNLQSAYKFRSAARYLKRAKSIATQHGNQLLLANISVLEKSISTKHRDIPDYLEGEKRPEVVI